MGNRVNKKVFDWKTTVKRDPVAVIEEHLDQHGEGQTELAAILGKTVASLLLARKRPLSLDQIRKIKAAWPEIDANELITEYPVVRDK